MKKQTTLIWMLLILSIFLASIVFATDWYSYLHKKVEITMNTGTIFTGTVAEVTEFEICTQTDNLGNCFTKKIWTTIFLQDGRLFTVIPCEQIANIKEN
jgi:hypothetical protein